MAEGQTLTTKLSPRWLFKMGVFAIIGALFGAWGLYDGLVKYPARGERVAQFELLEYFDKADAQGRLFRTSVDDPAAELTRLKDLRASGGGMSDLDDARLGWLLELAKVNNLATLTAENTAMAARTPAEQKDTKTRFIVPASTRDTLRAELQGIKQPAPLSDFDILSQYVFAVAGWGVFLFVVWRWFRSATTKYRFEPDAQKLTLPDGRAITPSDIELVDKRDWHKYFVHLKLKQSGDEVKLDLLRFQPLEQWVLAMAKNVEGYEPSEEERAAEQAPAEAATTASE
ncbi:MAG: hypothetical protein KDA20_01615 [Phycisphaerales bacterium]|nr:hypothetical protein [Phycisphaerales bacterium]